MGKSKATKWLQIANFAAIGSIYVWIITGNTSFAVSMVPVWASAVLIEVLDPLPFEVMEKIYFKICKPKAKKEGETRK